MEFEAFAARKQTVEKSSSHAAHRRRLMRTKSSLTASVIQHTDLDPTKWSVEEVCGWIEDVAGERWVEPFAVNEILGADLMEMGVRELSLFVEDAAACAVILEGIKNLSKRTVRPSVALAGSASSSLPSSTSSSSLTSISSSAPSTEDVAIKISPRPPQSSSSTSSLSTSNTDPHPYKSGNAVPKSPSLTEIGSHPSGIHPTNGLASHIPLRPPPPCPRKMEGHNLVSPRGRLSPSPTPVHQPDEEGEKREGGEGVCEQIHPNDEENEERHGHGPAPPKPPKKPARISVVIPPC